MTKQKRKRKIPYQKTEYLSLWTQQTNIVVRGEVSQIFVTLSSLINYILFIMHPPRDPKGRGVLPLHHKWPSIFLYVLGLYTQQENSRQQIRIEPQLPYTQLPCTHLWYSLMVLIYCTFWYFLVLFSTFWYFLVLFGTFWYFLVLFGTFW